MFVLFAEEMTVLLAPRPTTTNTSRRRRRRTSKFSVTLTATAIWRQCPRKLALIRSSFMTVEWRRAVSNNKEPPHKADHLMQRLYLRLHSAITERLKRFYLGPSYKIGLNPDFLAADSDRVFGTLLLLTLLLNNQNK